MADVILRAGRAMDRLTALHPNQDVVIVSHGGTIRATVAHALQIGADSVLQMAILNLSLTRLERLPEGWRVMSVNELPGY
jgi:broad specificity phosphatase PhoE